MFPSCFPFLPLPLSHSLFLSVLSVFPLVLDLSLPIAVVRFRSRQTPVVVVGSTSPGCLTPASCGGLVVDRGQCARTALLAAGAFRPPSQRRISYPTDRTWRRNRSVKNHKRRPLGVSLAKAPTGSDSRLGRFVCRRNRKREIRRLLHRRVSFSLPTGSAFGPPLCHRASCMQQLRRDRSSGF